MQRTQPLCVPRGRCPRRPRSRSGAGQAARPAGPGIQGPGRPAAQTDGDGLSGPTGRSKIVSGPQGPAGDVAGSWPGWAGLALPGRHGPAWPRAAFGDWPWPPRLGPSAAPKQGPGPRRDPALSALGMGVPRVWVLCTAPGGWVPEASGEKAGWPSWPIPGLCGLGRAGQPGPKPQSRPFPAA